MFKTKPKFTPRDFERLNKIDRKAIDLMGKDKLSWSEQKLLDEYFSLTKKMADVARYRDEKKAMEKNMKKGVDDIVNILMEQAFMG